LRVLKFADRALRIEEAAAGLAAKSFGTARKKFRLGGETSPNAASLLFVLDIHAFVLAEWLPATSLPVELISRARRLIAIVDSAANLSRRGA
jgi:hypothetical protein